MLLFFHYPPLCKKFREVKSHTANYMIVARINLLRAGSWPHLTVLHPYFTLVAPDFSLKPGNKEKTWEKNGFLKQKSPQRNNKIQTERVGAPGDHEDKLSLPTCAEDWPWAVFPSLTLAGVMEHYSPVTKVTRGLLCLGTFFWRLTLVWLNRPHQTSEAPAWGKGSLGDFFYCGYFLYIFPFPFVLKYLSLVFNWLETVASKEEKYIANYL